MKEHVCHRCGKCCEDMGTIWLQSPHPNVKRLYEIWPEDKFRDGGRCACLGHIDDTAYCLLEVLLGQEYKPEVCRKYPDPPDFGGKCHKDIAGEKP